MKKNILNLIAIVCVRLMTFANTSEISKSFILENETIEITEKSFDYGVLCYEIGRTQSTNPMTGITTETIYYRCIDLAQFGL